MDDLFGTTEATTRRVPRFGERGAAVVEFALVLPLLTVLLIGTMSAGLALNQKQQITHATREGARYAAAIAPAQAFTSGTWAQNVRDLAVERSAGDLTASDVCVSLVQGSPATVVTPAATYSTAAGNGPCIPGQTYPVTANDPGLRVQVAGVRPATIQLVLFGSIDVTLQATATAKAEQKL